MYCAWCGTQVPTVSYEPCPHCGNPTNGATRGAAPAQGSSAVPWVLIIVILAGGVVVVGGILSAIAIPNLLTAMQRSRQKRTMADVRTVATAVEAYATDKNGFPKVQSYDELRPLLVPEYIHSWPAHDGWDHPFRYACTKEEEGRCTRYTLGSAGKDGIFTHDDLSAYSTASGGTNFDCDIVFSNGVFLEYPEGVLQQQ
jgi:general secretion pathway protein G